MTTRTYLSIGDVLSLLREEFPDITISKIRFLESQGLVDPERSPSGYRKFYESDVERLRWVLRQQREHFLPLKVIRDRLAAAGSGVPSDDDEPMESGEAEGEGVGVVEAEADGTAHSHVSAATAPSGLTAVPEPAALSDSGLGWIAQERERMAMLSSAAPRGAGGGSGSGAGGFGGGSVGDPGAHGYVGLDHGDVDVFRTVAGQPAGPAGSGAATVPGARTGSANGAATTAEAVGGSAGAEKSEVPHTVSGSVHDSGSGGVGSASPAMAGDPMSTPEAPAPTQLPVLGAEVPAAAPTPAPGPAASGPGSSAGTRTGSARYGDTEEDTHGRPTPQGAADTLRAAARSSGGGAAAAPVAPAPPEPPAHVPTPAASTAGAAEGSHAPAPSAPGPAPDPAAAPPVGHADPLTSSMSGVSLTLDELCTATGLSVAQISALEGQGMLAPMAIAGVAYYDEEALTVAKLAVEFARYGIEPRHLRLYRNAADREIGLVEQVITPLLRQRNPEARQRAVSSAADLVRLGQGLRAALVRVELRRQLGG